MTKVIPAIIPTSRQHLEAMLEKVGTFTDTCQVDIVDGVFVGPASWPYSKMNDLETALATVSFDALAVSLDLMIQNPEEVLDTWLRTKPARMIVHVEAVTDLDAVLTHAETHGYQLGLAFNNTTDLSLLGTLDLAAVDFVQLMGIETIGKQGQPFDERVLSRIVYIKETYPDMPVSIDGAVSTETLPKLRRSGANRFVSGSAILCAPDAARAYRELSQLAGG